MNRRFWILLGTVIFIQVVEVVLIIVLIGAILKHFNVIP